MFVCPEAHSQCIFFREHAPASGSDAGPQRYVNVMFSIPFVMAVWIVVAWINPK